MSFYIICEISLLEPKFPQFLGIFRRHDSFFDREEHSYFLSQSFNVLSSEFILLVVDKLAGVEDGMDDSKVDISLLNKSIKEVNDEISESLKTSERDSTSGLTHLFKCLCNS
jgi:hypothetical protein